MSDISKTLDHELTMLYLSNEDLSNFSPEQLKQQYFDILHRIKTADVERFD